MEAAGRREKTPAIALRIYRSPEGEIERGIGRRGGSMERLTITLPYGTLLKLQAYIAREYPDKSRVLSAIITKAIDEFLERR